MKILQGEVFEDLYIKPNDNGEQMTQIGERKTYITDQMIHITGKYRITHIYRHTVKSHFAQQYLIPTGD